MNIIKTGKFNVKLKMELILLHGVAPLKIIIINNYEKASSI